MRIRSLSTLLVLVLFSTFAFGQRPAPTPGRNIPGSTNNANIPTLSDDTEVQVRVTWHNERPVDDVIHLQLINSSGVPIADTFTNGQGMAEFRNQKFGTYQLRADGPNIQDVTTDRFQIVKGEGMHMEYVHVQPRDANRDVGGMPQGQVSAAEMNVPKKARKEADKGRELMDENDFKEAQKHFEKAVQIYPKYSGAWKDIGVIKAKEGDRPGASVAWHKAIEADDRCESAYFNLARISLGANQPAEAQKLIEKGLSASPGDVEGLFLLVNAQAMQGNWDQVLANARKVHSGNHKKYPDIHLISGQALTAQNQTARAIDEYETYLEEYPDSPQAAQVRQTMAQLQAKVQ